MATPENPLIITDDDGNVTATFTGPVAFGGGHVAGGDIYIDGEKQED